MATEPETVSAAGVPVLDLPDAELAELDALEAAATPGPWTADPTGTVCAEADLVDDVLPFEGPAEVTECYRSEVPGERANNAAFIAAARNALPRLVAALRSARADRDLSRAGIATYVEAATAGLAEIERLTAQRDQAQAELATVRGQLEEASAVIILAMLETKPNHPAWVTLDGFDGSRDAVREVEALGYRLNGRGTWSRPVEEGADRG